VEVAFSSFSTRFHVRSGQNDQSIVELPVCPLKSFIFGYGFVEPMPPFRVGPEDFRPWRGKKDVNVVAVHPAKPFEHRFCGDVFKSVRDIYQASVEKDPAEVVKRRVSIG
jgi:hypothetical protein